MRWTRVRTASEVRSGSPSAGCARSRAASYPDEWNFQSFAQLACEADDLVEASFFIEHFHEKAAPFFVTDADGRVTCPVTPGDAKAV